MDLTRVVAIANGKGGVGKTSLTANLAGEFTRLGLRILTVDLDKQASLGMQFGVLDDSTDAGEGIYRAMTDGQPLEPITDIKPGIDYQPGGAKLEWIHGLQFGSAAAAGEDADAAWQRAVQQWRTALGECVEDNNHDLVLLDCPPGSRELQTLALSAARWILAPIDASAGSWLGVWKTLGPLVNSIRSSMNPDLDWLGMVLFGIPANATRMRKTVVDYVGDSGIPLLEGFVRSAPGIAQDSTTQGMLIREMADGAPDQRQELLAALRQRRTDPNVAVPRMPSAALRPLAEDYAAIAREIEELIVRAEAAADESAR